jgi:addiction module HigA family antidote
MVRVPTHRPPPHPGELLRGEFLEPLEMTQTELAGLIGVPFQRVNDLVNGRRGITTDTALRLAKLFRTTPDLWLNMQRARDLYDAYRKGGDVLKKIKPIREMA